MPKRFREAAGNPFTHNFSANPLREIECNICGQSVAGKIGLESHLRHFHKMEAKEKEVVMKEMGLWGRNIN